MKRKKPDPPSQAKFDAKWAAHPLTKYVPCMDFDGPEFAALLHDIEVSGQKEPIVLYEGKILDGRHRYEACRRLDRSPVFAPEQFKGTQAEALAYALSVKDKRGTITKSQKAVMAYRLLKDKKISERVEKKRREKIAATLKEGKARRMWETNSRNLTAEEKGTRARAIAADMLGINDRYVGYAAQLADKAPDLLEDVFEGKISLVEAVKSLEPAPTAQKAGVRELRGVKRSLESIREKLAGHGEAVALVEKLEAELEAMIEATEAQGGA